MTDSYFGMDSFSRGITETENYVNRAEITSKGVTVTSKPVTKYLDMDGLTAYHNLSQGQIKKLEERIAALEKKVFPISSAFVIKKLKRADLNLVFK